VSKFERSLKKLNTDRVYKQRKFNLQREASEGFSKVVCLLSGLTGRNVESAIERIKALIGYFELDPHRVLSLALDAMMVESVSENVPSYARLISDCFDKDAVRHLLGFKLSPPSSPSSSQPKGTTSSSSSPSPPRPHAPSQSLLRTVALCLKHGLITWDGIRGYMETDLGELAKESKSRVEEKVRGGKGGGGGGARYFAILCNYYSLHCTSSLTQPTPPHPAPPLPTL
jgi:hypothetical protein